MVSSLRVIRKPEPCVSFLFVYLYAFVNECGMRSVHVCSCKIQEDYTKSKRTSGSIFFCEKVRLH